MIKQRLTLPLSPPTTPRMPDFDAKSNRNQWQTRAPTGFNDGTNPPPRESREPHRLSHQPRQILSAQTQRIVPLPESTESSYPPSDVSNQQEDEGLPDDESVLDGEIEIDVDSQQEGTDRPAMTAEQLRALKRKMKRFRLTHSQTRYLVSEFARNAHPDAAHRDRLARDIPGMSPRRIQVWFQNRRAKLKRLTTDDRDRMMKSRTLPADFDTKQALRFEYCNTTPRTGAEAFASINQMTPALEGGEHHQQQANTAPGSTHESRSQPASATGVTPAMGGFAFTPPQLSTGATSTPTTGNVHTPGFYSQNSSVGHRYSVAYAQHPYQDYHSQLSQLHAQGRLVGAVAASPSQPSATDSALESSNAYATQPRQRAQSVSEQPSQTHWRPLYPRSITNPTVAGLGFYYPQAPTYQQQGQPHETSPSLTAFSTYPTMNTSQHPQSSHHIADSRTTNRQHSTPNLTSPQPAQYYYFGSHAATQPLPFTFEPPMIEVQPNQMQLQQDRSFQHHYTPVPNPSSQLRVFNEQEPAIVDNTEGGLPLPPSSWNVGKVENVPTTFA